MAATEDKHWIEHAIKHHGAFSAAAKKAGKSTEAFAVQHEHSPGVMGHRARLAKTLMHLKDHPVDDGDEDDMPTSSPSSKEYSTADMPKD